ncbi:MAG: hypothetical protein ACR2NY_03995 [Alphaproteobacteria bacterium]
MAKAKKISGKDSGGIVAALGASLGAFVGRDMLVALLLGFATSMSILLCSNLLANLGVANPPLKIAIFATLFFTLRFFFAPFVDKIPLPFLRKKFGQRRSMALLLQILLIFSLVMMMLVQNIPGSTRLVVASVVVAISALQIMSFEALRVEMLPAKKQAHGITMLVIGYFLLSLFVGYTGSWLYQLKVDFVLLFSVLQLIGVLAIMMTPMLDSKEKFSFGSLFAPFVDIFKNKQLLWLLPLLVLYKYGNSFMMLLSSNFYNGTGFQGEDQVRVAINIVQNMGPLVAIVGVIFGAIVIYIGGVYSGLMTGMILCLIAPIFFPIMLRLGANFSMLFATVSIVNISAAVSTLAIFTLIATKLNPKHSVTQWAFLTSVVAFTALPSLTIVPSATTLPLISQYLLSLPTSGLLKLFKINSPDVIAVVMVLLSLPGLLWLLAMKKNIQTS